MLMKNEKKNSSKSFKDKKPNKKENLKLIPRKVLVPTIQTRSSILLNPLSSSDLRKNV